MCFGIKPGPSQGITARGNSKHFESGVDDIGVIRKMLCSLSFAGVWYGSCRIIFYNWFCPKHQPGELASMLFLWNKAFMSTKEILVWLVSSFGSMRHYQQVLSFEMPLRHLLNKKMLRSFCSCSSPKISRDWMNSRQRLSKGVHWKQPSLKTHWYKRPELLSQEHRPSRGFKAQFPVVPLSQCEEYK